MIRTIKYSLEEGEEGFVLSFTLPSSGVPPKDQYILTFDTPVSLPADPPTQVIFEPSNGSYVIFGRQNLNPKVFIKIKSLHRAETKTLIRLTIKDVLNTTLYRDYTMIVCVPQTITELSATLLPYINSSNIGPKGGSIVRLTSNNNNNNNISGNTSQLDVGMIVRGPGIPTDDVYYITTIINSIDVELNQLIAIPNNVSITDTFQFIRQTGCVDPKTLLKRSVISSYTVLDQSNNWTYIANNKLIARFVPFNIDQNYDTVILLPIKNPSLLLASNKSMPIPDVTIVKLGGRLMRDSICAAEAIL
jgi:hypothetical protein